MAANNILKKAVEDALKKYDSKNLDLIIDDESGNVDIIYHSINNSFCVKRDICKDSKLSEADIIHIADNYDLGYCI